MECHKVLKVFSLVDLLIGNSANVDVFLLMVISKLLRSVIWGLLKSYNPNAPCMVYLPTFTLKINQM